MTVFLLRICFISTCTNALFNDRRLNQLSRTVVVSRRTTGPWRYRQRRNHGIHGTHSTHGAPPSTPSRRRRRVTAFTGSPDLLQRVSRSFADENASAQESAHRNSIDRVAVEHLFALTVGAMEDPLGLPLPAPAPRSRVGQPEREDGLERSPSTEAMPPPPPPASVGGSEDQFETRSTRSASSASRNTNRLSLTLPIAPPTAWPSRPTPVSSTAGSYPPTPVETPSVTSPTDSSDFMAAIAAQERRVLELKEDLNRAEHELGRLKKQWAHQEGHKKRAEIRRTEPLRPLAPQTATPVVPDDDAVTRRSVELDRRKALLLGQQSAQSTPTQSRRRRFQGGHTRTLSLLSPTKTADDFSVHEDQADDLKSPSKQLDSDFERAFSRYSPITPAQLSKRASWAPRSVNQVSGPLKQVADDLKSGLWTFVEDIRQATVGDEPITGMGTPLRRTAKNSRGNQAPLGEGEDTIRASGPTARPHVSRAFDDTPTPPSRFADPLGVERSGQPAIEHARKASRAGKHFSWTPLTVESYDDNDWSNWDSPTVKSPRWSGTTVNGDAAPATSGKTDENGTPLKKELSAGNSSTPSSSPTKLNELSLAAALNRLTPGNIKRTASDFMKEWEKSLSPPPMEMVPTGGGESEKEKGTV